MKIGETLGRSLTFGETEATMAAHFFETGMDFGILLSGIARYSVPPREFCAIQLASGKTIIATDSTVLAGRFAASAEFKSVEMSRDELSFRIASNPVRQSRGNPNLMPFV